MAGKQLVVPPERIEHAILLIRGQKVMLGSDLASLYGVSVKAFNQAVGRNKERFPQDFMLRLTWEEARSLRSQFVTLDSRQNDRSASQSVISKRGRHPKYLPYAFTEQGVAMLSSVLKSPRAVQVNIEIMRAFVRLRQILATHAGLARKLAALESKYDEQFRVVFEAIRELMIPPEPKRKRIGFHSGGEE
ncbi:MAG: ORF6N domain-containing protein [Planctomycetota bacterium]|nr:ORF6N domain-containing protein [Planctomycetota bacterium]